MKDLSEIYVGNLNRTLTVSRPRGSATAKAQLKQPAGNEQRDLCRICTYVSECLYRSQNDAPRLFCELFDVDVPALSRRTADLPSQQQNSGAIGGLCCNCAVNRTCSIRVSKGDVWHCEEYQ